MDNELSRGDRAPVIGEFIPAPGTFAEYEIGTDLTGLYSEPPNGLVLHYGAIVEGNLLSGSVWDDAQSALDFFSERAGAGLTEMVRRLAAPGRDPDLSYKLMPAVATVVGRAADTFDLRPRGEAVGTVLIRRPGAALPDGEDPNLILAVKLGAEDDHTLFEYFASEPPTIPEDASIARLHSLYTTEAGLRAVSCG